jgi:hypothetical protein
MAGAGSLDFEFRDGLGCYYLVHEACKLRRLLRVAYFLFVVSILLARGSVACSFFVYTGCISCL